MADISINIDISNKVADFSSVGKETEDEAVDLPSVGSEDKVADLRSQ